MAKADCLFEIQCEELPPTALDAMRIALQQAMEQQCEQQQLSFSRCQSFATPRRLAILMTNLQTQQADKVIERRGPALAQAFDGQGNPSKACIGFAKSCGVSVDELEKRETDKGTWLYCQQHIAGQATAELLPDMIQQAIKQLPVPKWMRWGNHDNTFARPVHHIVLLLGDSVIETEILGCTSSNTTTGHRFLCKSPITINKASDYEPGLTDAFVVVDFAKRKQIIKQQMTELATQQQLQAIIDDDLLDEVTGLVEWPTAMIAQFDPSFLHVPAEALISAMQDHQKSFPLLDSKQQLSNHFIFISNIVPNDASLTIKGNEKVMTARLSDAEFFYQTDRKHSLVSRVERLKNITFQQQLGSLYDKVQRLEKLCAFISNDDAKAKRAGLLAKTDLITDMVYEFTDLQGIMGYYYARHDGEDDAVAIALKEQYQPRHASDDIPQSDTGTILSIADKIDNLTGSFAIGQIPTGNKDPFALRRAAIGIIRIIIEKQLSIDIQSVIEHALRLYTTLEAPADTCSKLLDFFYDRLRVWLHDQGFALAMVDSVLSLRLTDFADIHCRLQAVLSFSELAEADSLAAANKRVANILQKSADNISGDVDEKHLQEAAEKSLYQAIKDAKNVANDDYAQTLKQLATLKPEIDHFFDEVMVNADDKTLRNNRLRLLKQLRELFLQVADIAYCQKAS